MRRIVLLSLVVLLGCASSGDDANPAPMIEIRQLVGPAELNAPRGPIQVQYEILVQNDSDAELVLRRLELETVGSSAYFLRREPILLREKIAPRAVTSVKVWARAVAAGSDLTGVTEPVSLRGVAHFDAPGTTLRRVFLKTIPQGY